MERFSLARKSRQEREKTPEKTQNDPSRASVPHPQTWCRYGEWVREGSISCYVDRARLV